ncbi:MAG TPA: hypothetical protein PLN93_11000 [Vicinamibacterales bacterium]|nr:hypothetical protein [Vicinamibacterales bacterium]
MTVTLKKSGSSDIVLCDGADYAGTVGKFVGPLGDGSTEVAWEVQNRRRIGAAAGRPLPLGNAVHAFDLSVFCEFASEAQATAFRLSWAAGLYYEGATLEVAGDGDTVSYDPACIRLCRVSQNGVGCVIDYQFVCGAPQAVPEEEE